MMEKKNIYIIWYVSTLRVKDEINFKKKLVYGHAIMNKSDPV